jgi:hypothetical protein
MASGRATSGRLIVELETFEQWVLNLGITAQTGL